MSCPWKTTEAAIAACQCLLVHPKRRIDLIEECQQDFYVHG